MYSEGVASWIVNINYFISFAAANLCTIENVRDSLISQRDNMTHHTHDRETALRGLQKTEETLASTRL